MNPADNKPSLANTVTFLSLVPGTQDIAHLSYDQEHRNHVCSAYEAQHKTAPMVRAERVVHRLGPHSWFRVRTCVDSHLPSTCVWHLFSLRHLWEAV